MCNVSKLSRLAPQLMPSNYRRRTVMVRDALQMDTLVIVLDGVDFSVVSDAEICWGYHIVPHSSLQAQMVKVRYGDP